MRDESLKIKVRAKYESNDYSFKRLWELFYSDIVASHKTIESWAMADKKKGISWVKNRFKDSSSAIDEIFRDSDVVANLQKETKNKLKEASTQMLSTFSKAVKAELMDDYFNEVASNTTYVKIGKMQLEEMMDKNLLIGKGFADNSNNIATNAIFQDMLSKVFVAKYGKHVQISTSNIGEIINVDKLDGLSEKELLEMFNDLTHK